MTITTKLHVSASTAATAQQKQRRRNGHMLPRIRHYSVMMLLLSILFILFHLDTVSSFHHQQQQRYTLSSNRLSTKTTTTTTVKAAIPEQQEYTRDESLTTTTTTKVKVNDTRSRREILSRTLTIVGAAIFSSCQSIDPSTITVNRSIATVASAAALPDAIPKVPTDLQEVRSLLQQASKQLEVVPQLLKDQKWDAVRVVLGTKPLSDCWNNKNTPLLKSYADAIGGTPTGDEFAALEGREELIGHLRYLDTAVYNNVFNPIATEGSNGSSKALIDSYYNDPPREYNASKAALDGLIKLSD